MALTKIGTDGVKDDAVNAAKLADSSVDTNAIQNNAVTGGKIADGHVTTSKIPINNITTALIADEAVTLAKLPHGTSSNDGKFLRANNGADPTFETVTSTNIIGNADNRVITGSGTANTLNGESLVTIDSNGRLTLGLTAGGVCLTASSAGSTYGGALKLRNTISSNHDWIIAVGGGDNAYVAGRGLLFRDDTTGINHTQFQTNGNIRIVDGDLQVASGHGINFNLSSNYSGATTELLDDYEEGAWTPVVTFGGNSAGQSYHNQVGRYVKIGRLVQIQCFIYFSNKGTSTGTAKITGLPFPFRNQSNCWQAAKIGYWNAGNSGAGPGSISDFMAYGEINQNQMNIQRQEMNSTAAAINDATHDNLANNTDFMLSMSYITN